MKKLLVALLLVFFASNVEAANRYWVGGGSSTNWNATGNTNWSASSGGANNASVPTTGDSVYFDSNSGSGTSTLSASINVANVDFTGYTGTLAWGSATLTINSASASILTFSSGMTYSATSASQAISFTGSNDVFLTSAGHQLGNITVNGTGTLYLNDALQMYGAATFLLTAGNFDGGGFSVTTGFFSSSNSNTRSITMGGGLWTLTGNANGTLWNTNTTTNLSFSKGTSNIALAQSNSFQGLKTFAGGGLTFNDLSLNTNKASPVEYQFTGNNTFGTVTFYGPLAVTFTNINYVQTATQFNFDSSGGGFAFVPTSTQYVTFSQASGTVTMSKATLQGGTFTGGATFTATDSYDLGGNSGITITAPGGGGASGGYIIGGN